ncbi:unnamed protein product [Caenorhabditis auriculariae]|uniref:Uncharacterized protein n=1 Tax=Caenorhabditis auriculariae TaxID=2777116 RepID=A0A8S1H3A6_9PELO|nr:unnamed protein product [Caenorhabditis auriculariae]
MNIDIAAIVAGIVEKARLHEKWIARLRILKTCGDRVQADFDKLVFYFDLTHKMRGIPNFTSTDARWMIKLAQKIITTLDDDLAVLEKEIVDMDLLHRRTGQKLVREIVFLLLLLIALGVHGGGITGPGGCTDPIPLFQLPGFGFPKIFQKSFDVLNGFNKLFGPVPGAGGFAE